MDFGAYYCAHTLHELITKFPMGLPQENGFWCHDIMHSRIKHSLVVAHSNHEAHILADMTVVVINLVSSHDSYLTLYKTQRSRWI